MEADSRDIDIVALGRAHVAQFVVYPAAKIKEDLGFEPFKVSQVDQLPSIDSKDIVGKCCSTVENSLMIAAHIGCKTALFAKRGDDEQGAYLARQMAKYGITFNTPPLPGGKTFGANIYVDTESGEPTIVTVKGVSDQIKPSEIDESIIARSKFFISDAYNFYDPQLHQAVILASEMAQKHGTDIVFGLSQDSAVRDNRTKILDYIAKFKPNVLYGNHSEFLELLGEEAKEKLAKHTQHYIKEHAIESAVVTLGAEGAYVITQKQIFKIPPVLLPEGSIVDLTCAGDSFIGGFLAACSKGEPLLKAGKWGAYAASQTIQQYGIELDWNYKGIAKAGRAFSERKQGHDRTGGRY